jgi:hypothetical protein
VVLEVVHDHLLLLHHFGGVDLTFSLSSLVDGHMVVRSHQWISPNLGYSLDSHSLWLRSGSIDSLPLRSGTLFLTQMVFVDSS